MLFDADPQFRIPATMPRGALESGPFPADSNLVFQVELIDYKTAAQMEKMRKFGAPNRLQKNAFGSAAAERASGRSDWFSPYAGAQWISTGSSVPANARPIG